jgi:peroxiredoxin Q/BCP
MSEITNKVSIGNKIPSFNAWDQDGNPITDEQLIGQKAVIFFYPQDDTPTCTKEACNLRDNYNLIKKHGYEVFGVSKDSVKKHQKFIEKYDLPYSLIADPELNMLNAFGCYGPKKFMGKEVIGTYRTTVIIDEKGIITHIIDKVKAVEHTNQIKEALGW